MSLTPVFEDLHASGNLKTALKKHQGFLKETPLSYYLLQESAVLGCNGRYLGPLGSYIYATTIMQGFKNSPPIPPGHSGLGFGDIRSTGRLSDDGISTLPELLKVPDLRDTDLAIIITKTLHRS
jgi:hypothetical protein